MLSTQPRAVDGWTSVGQVLAAIERAAVPDTKKPRPMTRREVWLIGLSVAGALVGLGQVIHLWQLGAWPPHDLTAHWLAGVALREGTPVYTGAVGGYLTFVWAPPWAVIWGVLSLQPRDVCAVEMMVASILALRYVTGSWRMAGLTGWLPFVPQQLVTGNMDLLMAAALYAGVRHGSLLALFSLAKFSPAAVLWRAPRGTWVAFLIGLGICLLVTLPWLYLWPQWIDNMAASIAHPTIQSAPLLPRLALAVALLFVARPWAPVLIAAVATPAFYIHSTVLLLAPLRVWATSRR